MLNKRLKTPAIILAIGLVLCLVVYMITGILKAPAITQQDFNYSATYKLNGETKTLEGTYRCQFEGTGEGTEPLERYYSGIYLNNPEGSASAQHIIAQQDDLDLHIIFIFTPDFLMGDGDQVDAYEESVNQPYLAVFDKEGYEYLDDEHLSKFDAELISWETPQPIENTFAFKGFSRLHDDSMVAMLVVGILVIIACMIAVKKDADVSYKLLDKISIVLNFLVTIMAIPFIALSAWLMQIYVSGDELVYQLFLCAPAIGAFTIAASIALRRKGFTKAGFFIQFVSPALFALLLVLESMAP